MGGFCSQVPPEPVGVRLRAAIPPEMHCRYLHLVLVARYVGAIPEFSAFLARQSILVRPHQKDQAPANQGIARIGEVNPRSVVFVVEARGTAPRSCTSSVGFIELKWASYHRMPEMSREIGRPGRTRTCNLPLRRRALCPVELRVDSGAPNGIRTRIALSENQGS